MTRHLGAGLPWLAPLIAGVAVVMGLLAVAGLVLGMQPWLVVVYAVNAVVHSGLARLVAPRLLLGEDRLVVRSTLRTHSVPWSRVQRVAVDWTDPDGGGPLIVLERSDGGEVRVRGFTLRRDRESRDQLHTDLERAALVHDVRIDVEDPSWSNR